jgi:hypothetical protein
MAATHVDEGLLLVLICAVFGKKKRTRGPRKKAPPFNPDPGPDPLPTAPLPNP